MAQRAWPSLQVPPHQPCTQKKMQSCSGLESGERQGEGEGHRQQLGGKPLVLEAPEKSGNKN